jgi:transposase
LVPGLRGGVWYGLGAPKATPAEIVNKPEELIENRPELIAVVGPLLKAREAIEQQIDDLDRKVLKLARYDAQIRRFMTVPGVGPITALCFKATIDDPSMARPSALVARSVSRR